MKSCKGVREDGNDRKESVDPRSLPGNGNQPSRDKMPVASTHVVNTSTSDTESASSEFSILSILKINEIPWQKPSHPIPTKSSAHLIKKIGNITLHLCKYQLLFFKAGYISIYRRRRSLY